jgi:hypothetical protein
VGPPKNNGRIISTVLVVLMSITAPNVAGAQSMNTFDGAYKGVSNTAIGGGPTCDPLLTSHGR